MKSTTARTKSLFERLGYRIGLVEKWIPQTKRRLDLFGFADLIAFHPDKPEVVLIQSTSGTNHSHRREKILALDRAREWVQFETRCIAIVSFSRRVVRNKDGKKSKVKRWKERIEFITERDFAEKKSVIPF